jgi:hypothetical protein
MMDNESLVKVRHQQIMSQCPEKLRRDLTEREMRFITSRGGFAALEMIMDTVNGLEGKDLEDYLNQEQGNVGS